MITPLSVTVRLQQAVDSLRTEGGSTAFDSVWGNTGLPVQPPNGLERIMLAEDKLYVVLTVVLLIWIGISIFLLRTDRKLDALERKVAERIPEDDDSF